MAKEEPTVLLDRIDIDTHGLLNRVELGPFSQAMNLVSMPIGAGKTALVRFVRDSLVRRQYPLGMMNSSAGRVVWVEANGKIHCRREQDGSQQGRRTIEFESRGDVTHRFDYHHDSWINGIADTTPASRALLAIQLPDSIVDGILTDTAVSSVTRSVQACLLAGLCDPELIARCQNATQPIHTSRPTASFADLASSWLNRLSSGRLRTINWDASQFVASGDWQTVRPHGGLVDINGQPETQHGAAERALAVIAVRLAAADVIKQSGLMASAGHGIPLLIETQPELITGAHWNATQIDQLVQTLRQASESSGHQLIVLTSDRILTNVMISAGAKSFAVHGKRDGHQHRPLWKPHYALERYSGPHYHATQPITHDPSSDAKVGLEHYSDEAASWERLAKHSPLPEARSLDAVNEDLDQAYWESTDATAAAFQIPPMSKPTLDYPAGGQRPAAPGPVPQKVTQQVTQRAHRYGHLDNMQPWADGYYFSEHFTTDAPIARDAQPAHSPLTLPQGTQQPASSQSPSQSLAAGQPPLGLSQQASAQSPFFLNFDSPIDQAPSIDAVAAARLRRLEVTHINHLMNQDPNRLSDALGLAGVTAATVRRWQAECRLVCHVPQLRGFDARILVGCGIKDAATLSATNPNSLLDRVEAFLATERGQQILLSGTSYELARLTSWIAAGNVQPVETNTATTKGTVKKASAAQAESDSHDEVVYEFVDDHGQTAQASSKRKRQRQAPVVEASAGHELDSIKFYSNLDSPIVDAPSIGERMASHLHAIDLWTVADLVTADAETVADQLQQRRVDAAVVTTWQAQATLMCRVPNLRGHDAQLLIAAEITSPEELTEYDAETLLDTISPIAKSNEGKRILRGSQQPDLEELQSWIDSAYHQRELRAA